MSMREFFQMERQRCLKRCERLSEIIAEYEEEYDNKADFEVRRTLKGKIKARKDELNEAVVEWRAVTAQLGELEQNIEVQKKALNGDLLYYALLRLNYHAQEELFQHLMFKSPVGAFLIHGKPGYGQRWLLSRLMRSVPYLEGAKAPIKINLQFGGYTWDIDGLQQQFRLREDFGHICSLQDVIDQIHRWWKTQTVVLIFDNLHDIEYTKEFIKHFWLPLVDKVTKEPSTDSNLIVFLIDNEGYVDTCSFDFAGQLFVKLPGLVPLLNDELQGWITSEGYKLPMKIQVEDILKYNKNGLPEKAFIDICVLCGCNWYKEIPWKKY